MQFREVWKYETQDTMSRGRATPITHVSLISRYSIIKLAHVLCISFLIKVFFFEEQPCVIDWTMMFFRDQSCENAVEKWMHPILNIKYKKRISPMFLSYYFSSQLSTPFQEKSET
jgi:hypothetical protein